MDESLPPRTFITGRTAIAAALPSKGTTSEDTDPQWGGDNENWLAGIAGKFAPPSEVPDGPPPEEKKSCYGREVEDSAWEPNIPKVGERFMKNEPPEE